MPTRCHDCGVVLVEFEPTDNDLQHSMGVQALKTALQDLEIDLDNEDIKIGICPQCTRVSVLGPPVTIEGFYQ